MIKKFYHGMQKAVHQFRFKNVEQHLLLGSGGNQNLRPSCRRPPTRTFHPPVGTLRCDAPALVRVRSPNDGNKLGSSLLSPFLSSQPHHAHHHPHRPSLAKSERAEKWS